ncbi:unnamed protein product [Menidia menidia]|uniref:(Atlantic silverside) hypothetical protein n=1 Tax=Menidia menidia TaxID=238744 RepID=A0A8S4AX69_9TELE|nr:unnamed protein product [Menidia menidia]
MQRWAVICWALLALVGAEECPDGGRCEEGNTCCNTPANGYGCCPFDKAECCGDHIHCCPQNTLCDQATSSCGNATVSVPWRERTPADEPPSSKSFRMIRTYMGEDEDNICPDQSRCPPEFSCLKALTKFGCCPLAKGVSCSDGKHCCPEGHRCSMDSRSCIRKELVVTVLCGDGVSECPEETTCCETPEGKWGCCPMPKAVCCDDKKHCCPEGTTCDTGHMKCISSSTKKELPMWAKFPARTREDWENQKDGEKEVTAETAPDTDREKNPEANTVPPSKEEVSTESPVAMEDNVDLVPCNDTVACPDDSTCCKTQDGGWSCCLLPEAVCCADGDHCCPNDYKCTESQTSCVRGGVVIPWYTKIEASSSVQADPDPGSVRCDGGNRCPEHTSCCRLSTGRWGCCPLQNAVCCPDKEHCCPQGYTCNLASMSCHKLILLQLETLPLTPVYLPEYRPPPTPLQHADVRCDDQTSCNEDETCCRTSAASWGCCPAANAVCCSDMKHCCPTGYSCSPEGSCSQDTGLNWHNWHVFYANKKRALIV